VMEMMPRWGTVYVGLMVLVLVPIWAAYDALSPAADHGEMAVDVNAFANQAQAYAQEHQLADGSVQAMPDASVPVLAMQFGFSPSVLRLRTGETYVLEFVSRDVMHGFSLQMGMGSLNAVLMPGAMTMLEVMPTQPGEYLFLCNEYCGVGHQFMSGKVIVEGPPISPTTSPAQPTPSMNMPGH